MNKRVLLRRVLLKPWHYLRARQKRRQINDETLILQTLANTEWEGLNLHKATGLRIRRMYKVMSRLESAGMVKMEWEKSPPVRYQRRVHKLKRKMGER